MILRLIEIQSMFLNQINNTVLQIWRSEDTFRLIYQPNENTIDHSISLDSILKTWQNSQHEMIKENFKIKKISAIYEKSEIICMNRHWFLNSLRPSVRSLMKIFWDLNLITSRIVPVNLNNPQHIFWVEII